MHRNTALIDPITKNGVPFWSVMIPTYNCAKYLRRTLEQLMLQDPGPELMHIEVVDDCSSDNPEKVVSEVGKGRIGFFRQQTNVGHVKNFETCLKRSKGLWVHQLHGDDYVLPGFYEKMRQLVENDLTIAAAFCQTYLVNENDQLTALTSLVQLESGVIPNFLTKIAYRQHIYTPSIIVKREAYETLGGFDERLKWCEDWEMWVRISKHYNFGYLAEPLACYREHSSSNTARFAKNATKLNDFVEGIKLVNTYLPDEERTKHLREVMNYYGETWVIHEIENAIKGGDKKTAWANLKLANKMTYALSIKIRLWKLALRISNI